MPREFLSFSNVVSADDIRHVNKCSRNSFKCLGIHARQFSHLNFSLSFPNVLCAFATLSKT